MTRVLVVDDDASVGVAVRDLLRDEGFDVDAPRTPHDALADALRDAPDLVILDVNMPGMTGWEFCAILRRQSTTRSVPVLFLTGRKDIKDRITAMQFGGSAYLAKPFAGGELREKVRALIASPGEETSS